MPTAAVTKIPKRRRNRRSNSNHCLNGRFENKIAVAPMVRKAATGGM
jgi:hypothetical protein